MSEIKTLGDYVDNQENTIKDIKAFNARIEELLRDGLTPEEKNEIQSVAEIIKAQKDNIHFETRNKLSELIEELDIKNKDLQNLIFELDKKGLISKNFIVSGEIVMNKDGTYELDLPGIDKTTLKVQSNGAYEFSSNIFQKGEKIIFQNSNEALIKIQKINEYVLLGFDEKREESAHDYPNNIDRANKIKEKREDLLRKIITETPTTAPIVVTEKQPDDTKQEDLKIENSKQKQSLTVEQNENEKQDEERKNLLISLVKKDRSLQHMDGRIYVYHKCLNGKIQSMYFTITKNPNIKDETSLIAWKNQAIVKLEKKYGAIIPNEANNNDKLTVEQSNEKTSETQTEVEQSNEKTSEKQTEVEQSNEKTSEKQAEVEQSNEKTSETQTEVEQSNEKTSETQTEVEQSNEKELTYDERVQKVNDSFSAWRLAIKSADGLLNEGDIQKHSVTINTIYEDLAKNIIDFQNNHILGKDQNNSFVKQNKEWVKSIYNEIALYNRGETGTRNFRNPLLAEQLLLSSLGKGEPPKRPELNNILESLDTSTKTLFTALLNKEMNGGLSFEDAFGKVLGNPTIKGSWDKVFKKLGENYEKQMETYLNSIDKSKLTPQEKKAYDQLIDMKGLGGFWDFKDENKMNMILGRDQLLALGVGVAGAALTLTGVGAAGGVPLLAYSAAAIAGGTLMTGANMVMNQKIYSQKDFAFETAVNVGTFVAGGLIFKAARIGTIASRGAIAVHSAEAAGDVTLGISIDQIKAQYEGIDISLAESLKDNLPWALLPFVTGGISKNINLAKKIKKDLQEAEVRNNLGDKKGALTVLESINNEINAARKVESNKPNRITVDGNEYRWSDKQNSYIGKGGVKYEGEIPLKGNDIPNQNKNGVELLTLDKKYIYGRETVLKIEKEALASGHQFTQTFENGLSKTYNIAKINGEYKVYFKQADGSYILATVENGGIPKGRTRVNFDERIKNEISKLEIK